MSALMHNANSQCNGDDDDDRGGDDKGKGLCLWWDDIMIDIF